MEVIKLKGTGDGVKIYLSEEVAFSEVLTALQEKLRSWRNFFGAGHCNMYILGRKLDKSDMLRLEAVVKALLPECSVFYGERNNITNTVKLPDEFVKAISKDEEQEKKTEEITNEENTASEVKEQEEFEKIKEVVTTNFKSNRARLFEGTVKSGRTVESDGHLILVGDVEDGGTLIANGNVIVLGSLEGSVQSGCMGNRDAYIIAMEMKPTDLRIAHANVKYSHDFWEEKMTENVVNMPKKAYLINNEICFKDFLLKT